MTAILKPKYTAAGLPITWTTLTDVASSATAGCESAVVDNTSNLFTQVTIHVSVQPSNVGATANDKCVYFWAYEAILDDAPAEVYPDQVTGADADITAINPGALKYLGATDALVQNTPYKRTFDLATAFGGRIPRKWGLVARNYCGQALIAGVVHYQGSNMEIV
jgi:hypothetical protein